MLMLFLLPCNKTNFCVAIKRTIIHNKQPTTLTGIKEAIMNGMYNVDSGQ